MNATSNPIRRGFTLIELLISLTIIAILASVVLGALARASVAAKEAKTRATIAKLHNQIMLRWESYKTRRLPIDVDAVARTLFGVTQPNRPTTANLASARVLALRELMRLELPQRWEDLTSNTSAFPAPPVTLQTLTTVPSLSLAYLRRYNSQGAAPSTQFQAAECLYLIVSMGLEDTSVGTDQVSLREVGDSDGDGMPEFQDGWGNPISFLRWAPGFLYDVSGNANSDLQQPLDWTQLDTQGKLIPPTNFDPFDPLHVDASAAGVTPPRGFALTPLIYSSGPDEVSDIWSASGGLTLAQLNDPYHVNSPSQPAAGTPMDPATPLPPGFSGTGGYTDNIHNHLIGLQ